VAGRVEEDPERCLTGDRWFVDETYVKVSGVVLPLPGVDQHGQVIEMYVSQRRDIASARTIFTAAGRVHGDPAEVITDRAPALANAIEGLIPAALHNTGLREQPGRMRPRPPEGGQAQAVLGLRTERTVSVVIRGHALIQNLRRGHYEVAVDAGPLFRLANAFNELKPAI